MADRREQTKDMLFAMHRADSQRIHALQVNLDRMTTRAIAAEKERDAVRKRLEVMEFVVRTHGLEWAILEYSERFPQGNEDGGKS